MVNLAQSHKKFKNRKGNGTDDTHNFALINSRNATRYFRQCFFTHIFLGGGAVIIITDSVMRAFNRAATDKTAPNYNKFSSEHKQIDEYYWNFRRELLRREEQTSLGGQIKLTSKEQQVNNIVLNYKSEHLNLSYFDEANFFPAFNFATVKKNISETRIFKIIKALPKGANLHTHVLGSVSYDYFINNVTYRNNLYGCFYEGRFRLKFFSSDNIDKFCEWKLLRDIRKKDKNFDMWLTKEFTFVNEDPRNVHTITNIWYKFKQFFAAFYDLFTYRPVFEDMIYQSLLELYMDNIVYVEYRGNFYDLYEINGTVHDTNYLLSLFKNVVQKFKIQHPKFIGARYIFSLYRRFNDSAIESSIKNVENFHNIYSDVVAGFDLIGFEDDGRPLSDFVDLVQAHFEHLKYFFHAGETKWYGHTDLNLVDAVLLNSTRIGHAYALLKHPEVIKIVKEKNIGIEVSPISNQVLLSLNDLRDHPAAAFIAQGLPVIICNDDPGVWDASGLSYDWFAVFMAMTNSNSGLEVLKQFALNSIWYSAMTEIEKVEAVEKWNVQWNNFLDYVLLNERFNYNVSK